MNRPLTVTLALCFGGLLIGLAIGAPEQTAKSPEAPDDVRSYSIGYDLGRQTVDRLAADGVSYDDDALLRGIADAIAGRVPAIPEDRIRALLAALEHEVRDRDVQRRLREDPVFKALHDENLRRSRAFHVSFAREQGVETIPGVGQRRVLAVGSGKAPQADSSVVVNFRAELLDGYVFGDGRRAEFDVAELMPGAQRLVLRMREGDHWYVAMPPEVAFGAAGRDPDIGPNETILVDVELLEVRDAAP